MSDSIERAHATLDKIGGFYGNGSEELAPVANALATLAVAEQLKRIADSLEGVISNGCISAWARVS